ncbi:unnamed protein product [Rhodiola kirilowii]
MAPLGLLLVPKNRHLGALRSTKSTLVLLPLAKCMSLPLMIPCPMCPVTIFSPFALVSCPLGGCVEILYLATLGPRNYMELVGKYLGLPWFSSVHPWFVGAIASLRLRLLWTDFLLDWAHVVDLVPLRKDPECEWKGKWAWLVGWPLKFKNLSWGEGPTPLSNLNIDDRIVWIERIRQVAGSGGSREISSYWNEVKKRLDRERERQSGSGGMAQYRQSGGIDKLGGQGNGEGGSDSHSHNHHVVGIRAAPIKPSRPRRSHKPRPISIGPLAFICSIALILTVFFAFYYLSKDVDTSQDDEATDNSDFLMNVTRITNSEHTSDSRDWDRDDRRRDDDYDEDSSDHASADVIKETSTHKLRTTPKLQVEDKSSSSIGSSRDSSLKKGAGLYNEAGRDELKIYEAEFEESLKNAGQQVELDTKEPDDTKSGKSYDSVLADEYDDGMVMESLDDHTKDYDDGQHSEKLFNLAGSHEHDVEEEQSSGVEVTKSKFQEVDKDNEDVIDDTSYDAFTFTSERTKHPSPVRSSKSSSFEKRTDTKKKPKRRKLSGCDMKLLNSTSQLVEPLESKKFARFSLQYSDKEEFPKGNVQWEPIFAGHQTLEEREASFLARDQTINCGFVKGPEGYPSTGFDIAEDDTRYISTCHIAVVSCIFGNSDHLRTPTGKTVTRLSKKNVCFVMFMDEATMQTLSAEGQTPDSGFIGLWKVVVVKNLPYSDMRRVGKVPKFLAHRLFPSARYSIWLDSKLRLQRDPLLILEYFLWRKGFEYAISNHYDRHCIWEEVAQNKKLNKFNHTIIDQQFAFYQADGLKRFNASDPNKLLPSNVPEGSFIVRAHTPMSNLFSCLWFNEVDRFTPRDQLSFAYTYHKLRRMNPGKPFNLNMFKDCERRVVSKLYRHRAEDKRNLPQ